MSEPPLPSSTNGEEIPPWMKAVSKEALYDAEDGDAPDETDAQRASPTEEALPSTNDSPANDPSANAGSSGPPSSLRQKLTLSMADPSDIPTPDPDLQPTPVGSVRADLDKQLEKAVSVLQSRYATEISRSLVLEFALQRTLRSLRQDGDESGLVQWLDSELPPL